MYRILLIILTLLLLILEGGLIYTNYRISRIERLSPSQPLVIVRDTLILRKTEVNKTVYIPSTTKIIIRERLDSDSVILNEYTYSDSLINIRLFGLYVDTTSLSYRLKLSKNSNNNIKRKNRVVGVFTDFNDDYSIYGCYRLGSIPIFGCATIGRYVFKGTPDLKYGVGLSVEF